MGNKKQVKTILERYGKDWFSVQAGKAHKRGPGFSDPETRKRAVEARKRNKILREIENEIQTDDTV